LLQNDGAFRPADVRTDDGLVIIHTAAVAGRPRGALLSHGNVLHANMHLNNCFHLQEADAHLNLLPLFHVGGLFMATGSFHAGALNLNMSKFDAATAADLIEAKKVSLLFDFPPILASILNAARESGKDLTSLRSVIGLGTPDDIQRYQTVTGGTYYCMYGQTETSCLATMGRYHDQPGSAGKTIPLADIKLVDDNDDPVPVGQVGEIAMKGPMVFQGYWGLPEDTAHAFRGGWHHTGDLGRFDDNGFLWYAGRKADKELIKPGGENVYPAEVEKAILQHPAVAQTVVFGVPDPKWKEGIKAVCRLNPEQTLEAKELIRFVGEKIASFKKPQYVEFVQELPLLKDGMPDRGKIKELYGGPQ
jgi:long-chain acyl-CoA synthetase